MGYDMETIIYAGNEYRGRYLYLPTFGEVLISTTDLSDALMYPNGSYSSEEAQFVDEHIFYFVDPNEIEYDDNQLTQLLICELDIEEDEL